MCPGQQLHNPAHVQCVLITVWTQASSSGGGGGLQSVIKRDLPWTWLSSGTQTLQALMEPDDHITQQGAVQPGGAEPVAPEGKKKNSTKPNRVCWVAGSHWGSFTIHEPLSETENSRKWRIFHMKNTETLRNKEYNVWNALETKNQSSEKGPLFSNFFLSY